MIATLSLTETIIERLEMGEEEVRIGASLEEYCGLLDELEETPYIVTYHENEIIAKMGEATERHELLCGNIIYLFNKQYWGTNHRVYGSNCAVYNIEQERGYDPDALVVKGQPQLYDRPKRVKPILNPYIIVEVLSNSNKGESFQRKISFYKHISTLQYLVLIDQYDAVVETFERASTPNTWTNRVYEGKEAVLSIDGFDIALSAIYQNVLYFV